MTTIHAKVSRTDCYLKVDGSLTSGMVGVPVSFEFGPEWKGLRKTAVFYAGTVKRDRINIERSTTVPAEVLQKPMENLYVGIYGYREDGTIVIPTVMAKVGMILRGANPSGDPGVDPNLPIWADLERRVSDLEEGSGDAAVKSVNGISPDENGNVEIEIPESSGSSVTIDPTLTQSGQAADAKAVGDAIANLDIPSIEGLATEEYVDAAIANIDNPLKELYRAALESDAVVTITETADGIPFTELALTKFKIVLRCPKIQTDLSCYLHAVIGDSNVQLSPYEVVAYTADNVINIIDGIKFTDETWEFTRIRSKYYGDTLKAVVGHGTAVARTVLDNMPGNFTKFYTNPGLPAGTEVVIYGA